MTAKWKQIQERIWRKRLHRARLRIQQGHGKQKDFDLIAAQDRREQQIRERQEQYAHLDAIAQEE